LAQKTLDFDPINCKDDLRCVLRLFVLLGSKKMFFMVFANNGEYHSAFNSYRDAVDQSDMIHGSVTVCPNGVKDRWCWELAVANQGCELTWDEWTAQQDDERAEWEMGAQGIGTA
jgi:hypothetical protein